MNEKQKRVEHQVLLTDLSGKCRAGVMRKYFSAACFRDSSLRQTLTIQCSFTELLIHAAHITGKQSDWTNAMQQSGLFISAPEEKKTLYFTIVCKVLQENY